MKRSVQSLVLSMHTHIKYELINNQKKMYCLTSAYGTNNGETSIQTHVHKRNARPYRLDRPTKTELFGC